MKRFSEQFRKQSESIHMRSSEKAELKARLLSYMEYHPLPAELQEAATKQEVITSEPFRIFTFNKTYVSGFAGVFAMLMLVSIPVFAERAVPGDMLYPVKVQFNEEVRSTLAFSPYQKVAWETTRMERRIAEARLLASEGKLTPEAQDKVALAVKQHSDAAQREIAQLRESDSDEAVIAEIAFASALEVQSEVLESHVEDDSAVGRSVAALVQAVQDVRTTAEASQSKVRPSYEKLLGRVEIESTNIYELFASVKKGASEAEVANIERRLADIERKIVKATDIREGRIDQEQSSKLSMRTGEKPTDAEDTSGSASATSTEEEGEIEDADQDQAANIVAAEDEAVLILRSALMDIQKLINYMTHIDVRQSVSIEDLVPLTLTDEEMRTEIITLLDQTIVLQTKVSGRDIDPELEEKTSLGQTELENQISHVVTLLEEESFEAALELLLKAYEMALDLDRLTVDSPQKEVPVVTEVETSTTTSTTTEEAIE